MPVDQSQSSKFCQRLQAGFTLVELSIVLFIIAVILAAVTTGGDLYRGATSLKIQNDFISAWVRVWHAYMLKTGQIPPGDDRFTPTYKILKKENQPLCNSAASKDLSNAILLELKDGISLPSGNSIYDPHLYIYQDSDGTPRQLEVCWMTVPWIMQSGGVDQWIVDYEHVMRISGLTVELAERIDLAYDSRIDARHGIFRKVSLADSENPNPRRWETGVGADASQNEIVRAYLRLSL